MNETQVECVGASATSWGPPESLEMPSGFSEKYICNKHTIVLLLMHYRLILLHV